MAVGYAVNKSGGVRRVASIGRNVEKPALIRWRKFNEISPHLSLFLGVKVKTRVFEPSFPFRVYTVIFQTDHQNPPQPLSPHCHKGSSLGVMRYPWSRQCHGCGNNALGIRRTVRQPASSMVPASRSKGRFLFLSSRPDDSASRAKSSQMRYGIFKLIVCRVYTTFRPRNIVRTHPLSYDNRKVNASGTHVM